MKNLLLLVLLFSVAAAQAQEKPKLKDLLFSGKLKNDSGGVVRSTDDLSSRIDTTSKKTVIEKPKTVAVTSDSIAKTEGFITTPDIKDSATTGNTSGILSTPTRSNNMLWKAYNDSLTKTLKTGVLSSKQIKKDTYFLLFDYEIGTDGTVNVTSLTCTPANAYLQSQVKQILDSTPLHLAPVLDSIGQPHKVKRRQSFTITKD